MDTHIVNLKLSAPAWSDATNMAQEREISIGQLVNDLLTKEMTRRTEAQWVDNTPNDRDYRRWAI